MFPIFPTTDPEDEVGEPNEVKSLANPLRLLKAVFAVDATSEAVSELALFKAGLELAGAAAEVAGGAATGAAEVGTGAGATVDVC